MHTYPNRRQNSPPRSARQRPPDPLADVVDTATRSRMMSGIRGRDTKLEVFLRRALHRRGFRFRKNVTGLPGKPDIVLRRYNAIILANGCFWHGHHCHLFRLPATRPEFWQNKIEANMTRDARNIDQLRETGWRVLLVWECAWKGRTRITPEDLVDRTAGWITGSTEFAEIEGAA
ncbi:very short patch repair endonuclease [Roseivivax halodurans]|nr:very short patch repair endonuclease [Roseivivax halodurans]